MFSDPLMHFVLLIILTLLYLSYSSDPRRLEERNTSRRKTSSRKPNIIPRVVVAHETSIEIEENELSRSDN